MVVKNWSIKGAVDRLNSNITSAYELDFSFWGKSLESIMQGS